MVGAPSERWGETPVAFVVAAAGRGDRGRALMDWVNARLGKTQRLAALTIVDQPAAQRDRQGAQARVARALRAQVVPVPRMPGEGGAIGRSAEPPDLRRAMAPDEGRADLCRMAPLLTPTVFPHAGRRWREAPLSPLSPSPRLARRETGVLRRPMRGEGASQSAWLTY